MASNVAERIAERIDAMPTGERRAAQTLIANYPVVGLKTVAEFSQAAGVSSPTILRFVARLGFQHYPDFQSALQEELAAQLQSPATRTTLPNAVKDSAVSRSWKPRSTTCARPSGISPMPSSTRSPRGFPTGAATST